jgi:hypothetical protein
MQEGCDVNGDPVLAVCAVDINNASVMMGTTPPGPTRIALETILVSLNPGELLLEKSVIVWLLCIMHSPVDVLRYLTRALIYWLLLSGNWARRG